MQQVEEPNYIDTIGRIQTIDSEKAFSGLTDKEKNYSYHFARASWEGAKICYFERSYESPALLYMFTRIFASQTVEEVHELLKKNNFSDLEWTQIAAYIAGVYTNCGNYLSFGDKKFIPEISREKFWEFIKLTNVYKSDAQRFEEIWESVNHEVYEYKSPYGELGYTDKGGLTSYYSSNMTKEECNFVDEFLQSKDISPLNTRVIKKDNAFNILVCSIDASTETHTYKDKQFTITRGDFSPFMKKVTHELGKCIHFAANQNQIEMLHHYIKHFKNGDVDAHKDSQRSWIKDKDPVVETCIGFIEVYLDPSRTRGEWEGFVAVVDKEQSKKLSNLVDHAEEIITQLTWPKELEIEKFSRPDFTSLEVVNFASSGIPIGINLPNYEDVTRNEGFKNVNLQNCYGTPSKKFARFMKEEDLDIIIKYSHDSDFVIVSLHELLGHGTGRLLIKDKEGKFNFEIPDFKHPITGEKITTWYEASESWGGKFGKISSGYEECRADAVGMYLSTFKQCLEILVPGKESEWDDIVYGLWFYIAYAGMTGVEYYSPETKEWGQAHVCASYVLLQVLIEAGNGMIKIEETTKNDKPYLYFTLDRKQINTIGKKAIGEFLRKLQVYKSLGDVEGGTKFFGHYMEVNDTFLRYRKIIMDNKVPRRMELQHGLERDAHGHVLYKRYEESFEGIIKSQVDKYRETYEDVFEEWKKYKDDFRFKGSKQVH